MNRPDTERNPTLYIVLEGGLVQDIVSDQPNAIHLEDLVIVDYDTDGADDLTPVRQADGSTIMARVYRPFITKATISVP